MVSLSPSLSYRRLLNPRKEITLQRLVLNIPLGDRKDRLVGASHVLEILTGQAAATTKSKDTDGSIRRNDTEKIACYATVRGDKALHLLDCGLKVRDYKLRPKNFRNNGCFGFGITEHIELGPMYDPSFGVYGVDFYVALHHPSYHQSCRGGLRRVGRYLCWGRGGIENKITKDEAMEWFEVNCKGVVLNRPRRAIQTS